MLKLIFSALLPFSIDCFSQHILHGQLLSIVDSTAVPGCSISINEKKHFETDSNGFFNIPTSRKYLHIIISPKSIHRVDTIINRKSTSSLLKLFSSIPIDSALALFDLKNNRAVLFCGGGLFHSGSFPTDKEFEEKYSIKYVMLDCAVPPLYQLDSYNKVIANHLDSIFGNSWRNIVRPDVFYVSRKAGH